MRPIHIVGFGLWTPGFPDPTAWREGRPDPDVVKPPCRLVNARLKRGSSRFANMLGEVVEQAATAASIDVTKVPTFYGSSLGEIETMVTLLRMLYEEEGKLSPNRFKNSVHNAASGLVSIGTENTAFSTAIAGGTRSFEATLIEAWAYLEQEGGSVILAVADDRAPEPLDALDDHEALAIGIALALEGDGPRLEGLRAGEPVDRNANLSAALRASCASPGLELLDAVLARRAGPVALSPLGGPQLVADLVLPA
ncbi:MAG: beta-ketoacyl synthase chain length factor [Sandaracinaceae bacterium]|nr:beta-ketoacyl synthase chain length factor [Sandaracinaceae bacterium]